MLHLALEKEDCYGWGKYPSKNNVSISFSEDPSGDPYNLESDNNIGTLFKSVSDTLNNYEDTFHRLPNIDDGNNNQICDTVDVTDGMVSEKVRINTCNNNDEIQNDGENSINNIRSVKIVKKSKQSSNASVRKHPVLGGCSCKGNCHLIIYF